MKKTVKKTVKKVNTLHHEKEKLYSLDELLEVWRLSHYSGMIMSMAIHNNIEEPKRQEAIDKVANELYSIIKSEVTLKSFLSDRLVQLGIISDILELKELK